MAVVGGSGHGSILSNEAGFELKAELGLRFARLGLDLRPEIIVLPTGSVIEVVRSASALPARRFAVGEEPASLQADRILRALMSDGWTGELAVARGGARGIGSGGFWCVPE